MEAGDLETARKKLAPFLPRNLQAKMPDAMKWEVRLLHGVLALRSGASDPMKKIRRCFSATDPKLAAYARAYEERHPETKRGVAGALGRHGSATELSSFADLVAEKRAITARQVRKIAAAGRALSRDDATRLRAAPKKMTLNDLLTLARAPAEKRDGAIALFAGGGKIADALRAPSAAPKDPVEEAFKALRDAWERAPEAARRRFVAEFHAALSVRVRDEAERRIVNGRLGEAPESAAADVIRGKFGPRAKRGRTA